MQRFPTLSILIAAPWLLVSPAVAAEPAAAEKAASEKTAPTEQATPTPGRAAGQETSDRTPGQDTTTPLSQTTQVDGETSDRTPAN